MASKLSPLVALRVEVASLSPLFLPPPTVFDLASMDLKPPVKEELGVPWLTLLVEEPLAREAGGRGEKSPWAAVWDAAVESLRCDWAVMVLF